METQTRTLTAIACALAFGTGAGPFATAAGATTGWQGVGFDDEKWETTTVPEWRYRTRENDDTARNPDKLAQWNNSETAADTICWYRTTGMVQLITR